MAIELPDFWTLLGLVLALLALVAAMISVPSASRVEFLISRFCAIAAAVLFLIKIGLWGAESLTAIRIVFVAFFGALIALALAFSLQWINKKQNAATNISQSGTVISSTFYAECQFRLYPIWAPGEQTINFLPLSPLFGQKPFGYLAQITLPTNQTQWPPIDEEPRHMYRCAVTNHGPVAVLNLTFTIRVTFLEVISQPGGGMSPGKVIDSSEWPINVPTVEADKSKPFVIWLSNMNEKYFAEIKLMEPISFQRADESDGRLGRLLQPINPTSGPSILMPARLPKLDNKGG